MIVMMMLQPLLLLLLLVAQYNTIMTTTTTTITILSLYSTPHHSWYRSINMISTWRRAISITLNILSIELIRIVHHHHRQHHRQHPTVVALPMAVMSCHLLHHPIIIHLMVASSQWVREPSIMMAMVLTMIAMDHGVAATRISSISSP